jgi:hypothetical protein
MPNPNFDAHNLSRPTFKFVGFLVAFSILGCNPQPAQRSETQNIQTPYVCGVNDYRQFEKLTLFQSMDSFVPRLKQTQKQRADLDPGNALWHMPAQPQLLCTPQHHLEMRYSVMGAADFANAHSRLTVLIAPAGHLLDAVMLQRLKAMSEATDEALIALRTKNCSLTNAYEPCDLKRNPDPLRLSHTGLAYSTAVEFPKEVGSRAWRQYFKNNGYFSMKTTFTTTDGKFDISFLIESTSTDDSVNTAFFLVPERISNAYDKLAPHTRPTGKEPR